MGRRNQNDPETPDEELEQVNAQGETETTVEVQTTERRIKLRAPHDDITSVSVEGEEVPFEDGYALAKPEHVPHLRSLGFVNPPPKARG